MDDRELVALRCSAIVLRQEAVLLCRRTDAQSWVLPGGSPHPGEGSAACARREVLEETGITIDADRVAFVLEATNPAGTEHLIEIVFLGSDRQPAVVPRQLEPDLVPRFMPFAELAGIELLPPIAGYLRGLARRARAIGAVEATAPYLGNVWRSPQIVVSTGADVGADSGASGAS